MGRSIRIVSLVLLVSILAFVVWLRLTQDGRNLANDLSDRVQVLRHGGEEKAAAEKLKTLGARFGPVGDAREVSRVDYLPGFDPGRRRLSVGR